MDLAHSVRNAAMAAMLAASSCLAFAAPQVGWWWNPDESGRGYFIESQSGIFFMAAYFYADDGRARWLVAGGDNADPYNYSGRLLEVRGGQTLYGPYVAPGTPVDSGAVTVSFSDATHGSIVWPGGTIPIVREIFDNGTALFQPQSGWWWNPDESGNGYSIEVEGGKLFMVGFMYDDAGNPVWYLSAGSMSTPTTYHDSLVQVAGGQTLAGPYHPPDTVTTIGTVDIAFSAADAGTLTFTDTLMAQQRVINVKRQFTPPSALACYTGTPLALLPPEPSAAPGDDFVDPVTGHRIVRLSRLENGGASFYFTQNEFNCRGNKLVFANAHGPLGRWLYSIDLETFDIQRLAKSEQPIFEVVAPKRNEVLYVADDGTTLRATNLDTHATRSIAQLPAGARGFTINSDETLIAGFYSDGLADYQSQYPTDWGQRYCDAHKLSYLFTVDADSGAFKRIHEENNWLDHVQFSPSDPRLLLFVHQCENSMTDSVSHPLWLIDATGTTAPRSLYTETVTGEFVVHSFWSPDGRRVYFDHQVPVGENYFISWVEVATGTTGGYPIAKADWGLHYNISHDGSMFASDGDSGDAGSSRKTLLLYRIVNGSLQVEPLADLSASDYSFQPNVHFTPDGKWVVYQTSQGFHEEIYAVSVAK